MEQIFERIQKMGIVPVIVLNQEEDAAPLAEALCRGGLPCAEITFRTAAAAASIRAIKKKCPEMLVGAGTVLTTEQVDSALDAGAEFIVSPGLNKRVVSYCTGRNIPIIPGTSNPSDVEQALELGLKVVKFFPAEAAGGINMIKAMAAPYTNVKFMPTGGISPANLNDYLSFSKVLACGGSFMVKEELIRTGQFDKITALTNEAVMTMLGFKLVHVGINCSDEEEADQLAGSFASYFGFEKRLCQNSIFAGTAVEAMKQTGFGTKGHIAIGTNSVLRAVHYLEAQGAGFNRETARYQGDELTSVYLDKEIGGFAVHLLKQS